MMFDDHRVILVHQFTKRYLEHRFGNWYNRIDKPDICIQISVLKKERRKEEGYVSIFRSNFNYTL